jgi:hypothetical protein
MIATIDALSLKEEQVQHPLMNLISTGLAKPDTAYYGT